MTRPVPLMFINGPSDSVQLPIADEESTSVFMKNESSTIIDEEILETPEMPEIQEINPSILLKLNKIQSPFGRRLYQPLTFKLTDGRDIVGTVEEIEEHLIYINLQRNEKEVITVKANEIMDIIWRGNSLPES